MIDDAIVADYLGLTTDQVRLLRMSRGTYQCAACSALHPTMPIIRVYHFPVCKENGKCRMCGGRIDAPNGHEVGLIRLP